MFHLLRFLLFFLSFLGYCEFLRKRTSIDASFLPSAVIAVQFVLLFLTGILAFLKIGTLFIFFVGLCMLAMALLQEKSLGFLKNYCTPAYCFLVVMFSLSAWYLRDKTFLHWDNFTHWALVARNMLETNRFPNFKDSLVMFHTYPLGSSAYIYYFTKLIGRNEPTMMLAQVFMMLAATMPVFSFCRKNQWFLLPITILGSNLFFLFNIQIYDLLVDTLLPLVGMCSLCFLFAYREKCNHKNWEFWIAAAYLVHTSQIKNSGLFFLGIAYVMMLIIARKTSHPRDLLLLAAIPPAFLFLWKCHCSYVFDSFDYTPMP